MTPGLGLEASRPAATPVEVANPVATARMRRRQLATLGSLAVGYMGYYLCRSNFSLGAPLLLEEFGDQGITKETIGRLIASIGVLCYAVGKVSNGILCDFPGGRGMFVGGMLASVACTVLFGTGMGFAIFVMVWSLNRLFQFAGWGALVKVSSVVSGHKFKSCNWL